MRLDRLVGRALHLGGRAVREKILSGAVVVDGSAENDRSRRIGAFERVECDGLVLQGRERRALMMHKPAGVVSATTDREHRTAIDLIDEVWREELHLAGRLDRFTTGLLILTNDSEFSESLTAPDRKVPKGYRVETERPICDRAVAAIRSGIRFEKERATSLPAQIELDADTRCRLTIYEGKHHQIKRMFAKFDIKVTALHRFRIGEIWLDPGLSPGEYRPLTEAEAVLKPCPAGG